MCQKLHIIAAIGRAFDLFDQGKNDCANQRAQVITPLIANHFFQQNAATFVDFPYTMRSEGVDQRILAAEMIANRRLITLPCGERDPPRGYGLDAVCGEKALSGREEALFRTNRVCRHVMRLINDPH